MATNDRHNGHNHSQHRQQDHHDGQCAWAIGMFYILIYKLTSILFFSDFKWHWRAKERAGEGNEAEARDAEPLIMHTATTITTSATPPTMTATDSHPHSSINDDDIGARDVKMRLEPQPVLPTCKAANKAQHRT